MGKKKKSKRVVVVADMHCGHRVGLTPPSWQYGPQAHERRKTFKVQKALWDNYAEIIDSLKPIDVLLANGDLIDGRGEKSGSTELTLTDRVEQVDCAAECINYAEADTVFMTYGTAYHSGKYEDWEELIAQKVNARSIKAEAWVEVNDLVFNLKHHVGSSQVPHGRFTALARDRLWQTLWTERGTVPKADVVIRSHSHYFGYCGGADWIAMTTPALQGRGSKYGGRRLSGLVDFGLVHFDVTSKEEWTWEAHVKYVSAQRSRVQHI